MGEIAQTIEDKLISFTPDRNGNRILIYKTPTGEVAIHHRNLKIHLISPKEISEWREGFKIALDNFKKGDYFKNDI